MPAKAYELAEKWQDYRTLVELCLEEIIRIEANQKELSNATSNCEAVERESAKLAHTKKQTIQRMEAYFNKFGEVYAIEIYEYLVENGQLQNLLNGFENWRETYLTRFLRCSRRHAKLSWIHDVGLGEYALAADTLLEVATEQEEDLWNKKVEISIGKLAKIAAMRYLDEQSVRSISSELELVDIQNCVYEAVKVIGRTSIGTDGAMQIVLEKYAGGTLTSRKPAGCRQVWKPAFAWAVEGKVMRVHELADLLTLVESDDEGTSWQAILDTHSRTDKHVQAAIYDTAVYTTIKFGYECGLFARSSPYQPLTPEETFFSDLLEELHTRFARADESELNTIGLDLLQGNKLLTRSLKKAQLHIWPPGMLNAAKRKAYSDYVGREERAIMEEWSWVTAPEHPRPRSRKFNIQTEEFRSRYSGSGGGESDDAALFHYGDSHYGDSGGGLTYGAKRNHVTMLTFALKYQ
ncbi:Non-repetitive/WGA-negative nucleoporin C-terminal-domain-containing protein [Tuber borchii]|uniref:Non-repetitive/WGA-negative nucleoporin C-terminal-domain-containing protein n=1 Tax=Tuber borchii TaxID=42251 RepID=A0A2T6ZI27_TUBBO|nr:Non-repetitive/WGA-negative nucleoporin C-terminal-domain-containing protein [Tuber borchii]